MTTSTGGTGDPSELCPDVEEVTGAGGPACEEPALPEGRPTGLSLCAAARARTSVAAGSSTFPALPAFSVTTSCGDLTRTARGPVPTWNP